ncbi:hypothetical protein Cgig2_025047 [Carnegiea gigantea]|uniref:U-box domain-containing protein n=1 Tax=Carnegiea gigantea TaxID=171969 RepID=A0A9Q1Q4L9_9CARY|nr:hypothetical protein Cgig2_025047 [Carnegiea gigantea]
MNLMEQQEDIEVPPYFLCPISLQIMKDPVTVSTGITYERENIEQWVFTNKNTTCPVTKRGLNADMFTPNHILRRLIQSWCTLHASAGIEQFPTPKPPATQAQVLKLIREADRPNNDSQTKVRCLRKLRSIASHSSTDRRCLESAGAVEFLSRVIVEDSHSLDQDVSVSDEALSILSQLKISDEERLKKLVVETQGALFDSLTRVMSRSNFECRAHAVELLKSMMQVVDPAQAASVKLDHLTEVVQVIKDQVSPPGNQGSNQGAGSGLPVGEELKGRSELLTHGTGIAVVSKKILRVSHFASERGVRILASIAKFSASPALGVVTKLCLVLQVDCDAKTMERARETLKLHARAWRNSPCARAPHHMLSSS